MREKVLVSGGAGFIGSHVVDRYIQEGYSVVVVDNLSSGFREYINSNAKFYEVDICDARSVREVFDAENPAYVNHHAAQIEVRKSVVDPLYDARVNIFGSMNLIIESAKRKVKKFIYASTGGAIYGVPERLPVSESFPQKPLSPYGVSKKAVENYLYVYACSHALNYTVLRYANVYGPRQNPHGEAGVVAIFTEKMLRFRNPEIFGSGEQTRDYVFVEDVVDANMLSMEKGDRSIYNIGTGIETSVIALYEFLAKLLSFSGKASFSPARKGEVDKISLDTGKALRELAWEPGHSLEEGLLETVSYYRTRG